MQKGFDVSTLVRNSKKQVVAKFNDQVSVTVNFVPRDCFAGFVKQASKTTWDRDHQPVETFDNLKFGELLGVEAIAGWDGLVVDGEPLPCTPENIKLLMRKWSDFAKFVSSVCTDLERLMDLEMENERKNFGNTSGQDPTIQG